MSLTPPSNANASISPPPLLCASPLHHLLSSISSALSECRKGSVKMPSERTSPSTSRHNRRPSFGVTSLHPGRVRRTHRTGSPGSFAELCQRRLHPSRQHLTSLGLKSGRNESVL